MNNRLRSILYWMLNGRSGNSTGVEDNRPVEPSIISAWDEFGDLTLNSRSQFFSSMVLMITNECPVKCAHCINHSGGLLRGDAERDLLRMAIDQATEISQIKTILFTGGEPFTAPELLLDAVTYAKQKGFRTSVYTSANFAETEEQAMEALKPLKPVLDELGVSIDHFHQLRVPLDHVRNCIRAGKKIGYHVTLMNVLTAQELDRNLPASEDAMTLSREFGLTIACWPMLRVGRGARQKELLPKLPVDQTCGMLTRPSVLPSGEVHACCAGAGLFNEGHPLNKGKISDRSLKEIQDDIGSNLFDQSIRAFGPLRVLQMLGEDYDGGGDQCTACNALCKVADAPTKVREHVSERPDLIQAITEYRTACGDVNPSQHEQAKVGV